MTVPPWTGKEQQMSAIAFIEGHVCQLMGPAMPGAIAAKQVPNSPPNSHNIPNSSAPPSGPTVQSLARSHRCVIVLQHTRCVASTPSPA